MRTIPRPIRCVPSDAPRRPRWRLHALLLALACALPGCLITRRHVGRDLPGGAELALTLEIGRTTKHEVLATIGAPISIRRQFDGDLLLWQRSFEENESLVLVPLFTVYLDSEGSSRSDRLALLFDHDGVLSGIGLDMDIVRDARGRPVSASGQKPSAR